MNYTMPFKRSVRRIVFFTLVFTLAFSATAADPEVENFMTLGQAAFNQGDVTAAMDWFRRAADQGYAPAQVRLGEMLDYSEQNEQAFEWYRRAAEQGNPDGEYWIGVMYATGDGVDQDYATALQWFTLAGEHGQMAAIRSLSKTYEKGGLGMGPHHANSVAWLKRGVELEDHWATTRLAQAYRNGELGLAVDEAQAAALEGRLRSASE